MKSLLLLLGVMVAVSTAADSSNCVDQSRLVCSMRKSDCATVAKIRQLCPRSCGVCSSSVTPRPVFAKNGKLYNMTYFDMEGRAEQIRWILEQGNANWEDNRITFANWPALKPTTLTGQLPFLEVEGTTLVQSGAIAMYLARELGLAGSTNLHSAEVHMVWDTVQDAFNAMVKARLTNDKAEQAKFAKKFNDVDLKNLIKFLENRMKNGQMWLVGDKVSAADIVTASLLDSFDATSTKAVDASKSVSALRDAVKALPRIKNWLATRPVAAM